MAFTIRAYPRGTCVFIETSDDVTCGSVRDRNTPRAHIERVRSFSRKTPQQPGAAAAPRSLACCYRVLRRVAECCGYPRVSTPLRTAFNVNGPLGSRKAVHQKERWKVIGMISTDLLVIFKTGLKHLRTIQIN